MARKRNSRRHHRRSRFAFLYKLLTVLAICAVIVVAMTLFFKVGTIVVDGNGRYTDQEVEEASGVRTGDNLLLLNKYAVDRRLREQLPYIEDIHISRKLPDTLLVEVTEFTTTYALPRGEMVWLMSGTGKIVDACTAEEAEGLPAIDGLDLPELAVGVWIGDLDAENTFQRESLLELLKALEAADTVDQVQAIHLDSAAELVMDYADRFAVKMPYGADYDKMLLFVRTVMDTLETNETGVIDLTTEGEAHVQKD